TVAVNPTNCPKLDGFGAELRLVVLLAGPTVWLSAGDVLAARLAVPLKIAVIKWTPPVSPDALNVAIPFESTETTPRVFVPLSTNVILPANGELGPLIVTVAVNVTSWV